MKRPGALVFFFGNPAVLLILVLVTLYLAYAWLADDGAPVPALVAFIALGYGASCSNELRKYKDWKQEWDAMGGKAPGTRISSQNLPIRILLGIPAWLFGLYLVMSAGDDSGAQFAKTCFWLATAIGIGTLLYRGMRRGQSATSTSANYPDVTVCLAVPRSSPSVQEAHTQLPGYCLSLMQ